MNSRSRKNPHDSSSTIHPSSNRDNISLRRNMMTKRTKIINEANVRRNEKKAQRLIPLSEWNWSSDTAPCEKELEGEGRVERH